MHQRTIVPVLECYIEKDGKYLMLHRSPTKRVMPNVWMAPGGKRDFNEGLFACARREIMEETGLTITNLRVLCTGYAYLKDLNEELYVTFVRADYAGGELPANPEDGELVWLTLEEILRLDNLLGEVKMVLPIALKEGAPVISYRAVYERGNEMTEFAIEDPV